MNIALHGDYTNTGNMSANGSLTFSTDGTFTNQALFNALTNLSLTANNLDNQASGELSAGNSLFLNITNLLTNRGLITAPTSLIKAQTLNNLGTGRIYGDTLAIGATTITNDAETINGITKAGTIAAQTRLDLATTTLNNQNGALVFSLGDMAIGNTLDINNQAIGTADAVNNHAATIEAIGQLSLATNNLNNTNGGVLTEMQTVSSETITEYRIDYQSHRLSADKFLPQGTVIPCNPSTGRGDLCGWHINMGYAKLYPDRFGQRQYFNPIYPRTRWGLQSSQGKEPKLLYQPDATVYARFDIAMPAADATPQQKNDALQALHKAITAYNASVQEDNRVGAGGHYYEYKYTATKSQPVVTKTAPGVIRSGGAMTLTGTNLVNDKSRIIAGGAMTGDLANLRNIGMEGTATTTINGTVRLYEKSRSGRPKAGAYHPYTEAPRRETVTLPLYQVESHTQSPGTTPTARLIESGSSVSPVAVLSVPTLSQASRAQSSNEVVVDKVAEFGLSRQPSASATSVSAPNPALSQLVSEQPPPNTATSGQAAPTTLTSEQPAPMAAPHQRVPQAPQPLLVAAPRDEIRTVAPNITLPTASLYTINPSAPTAQPIIETDPRFTDRQQWLGSQALMTAGSVDPNITQKRLGDNFYEQQLIRDQVGQLTGRRFLTGYQNDNDQYQALINSGVSVAQNFQLTPGIALSEAQIAQLTTDIVWLVQKTITLPDGSTTQALVPQLYVKVQPGDLKGDGTLIAGDSVQFNLSGDLHNSGTIAGRTLVDISAQNIKNHHGRIQAADARLSALLDLHNIGGSFAADNSMALTAGQDVKFESTTQTTSAKNGSAAATRTHLDRVAGIYVGRNDGDTSTNATSLLVQAGRDFNLLATEIANHTTAASTFTAGQNINLQTLQTESTQTLATQDKGGSHKENTYQSQDIGSNLNTVGDLNLQAGQDIVAKASNINSEQGTINFNAGRDISLEAGQQTHHFDAVERRKSSGFLSSKSSTRKDSVTDTQALGTTVSGNTVNATAGNNITMTGSNMVSDSETNLTAANNVTVQNAQNSHSENHFYEEKKSGLMRSGGVGFTIGNFQQSKDQKQNETTSSASTVGATNGNVNITAGKTYTQVGSDVIALSSDPNNDTGNVNVNAQKIDVLAAENTASQRVEEKTKQSGLTIAVTSPVITAVQTVEQMQQAKSKTSSGRVKVLADAASAAALFNAGSAVAADPQNAGGVGISASVGSSQSQSVSTQTATTLTSSNVKAAKDVNFNATGAGTDSNINIVASNIKAGEDASFKADNDVNFLAGRNISEQHSKNSSSSASIGVGRSTSSGFTVNLALSKGRGKADGKDIVHTHTEVEAGQTLTVESGRDTNLKGATATGKKITANIGRDLNIESVQDKSTYDSKQESFGVAVAIPIMGMGKGSASASMSKSKVNSDYQSVTQQSDFKAGDNGFDINVAGNTDLKAGLIASTDQAAAANRGSAEEVPKMANLNLQANK